MNTDEGDKHDSENWSISELKNCPNLRIHLLGPTNIVLDYIKAYNVELLVRLSRRTAKICLNGVPKFLVDAFSWLEKNDALGIDGIFRKEGNANRLKNVWTIYCGLNPIHDDYNAHDVCSLIKRFFREIKTPIFTENQVTILKFAESLRGTILLDAILSVIERLPSSHVSTIAFLMRQLKRVSQYSEENRMSIDNLATVFAPSLFRDENLFNQSVKKKRDIQCRLMNFVRSRNSLQVMVVKLLIEKSHLLGPIVQEHPQNCFEVQPSQLQLPIRSKEDKLKKHYSFNEADLVKTHWKKQQVGFHQRKLEEIQKRKMDERQQQKQLNESKYQVFPRRTREYKSEKEMICTYCDMRGHLSRACPNV